LVSSNFPVQVVSLDTTGTNIMGTSATIVTTITTISSSPPLRTIHVDCIWKFRGAQWVTNSIETIRAADQ